MMQLTAYLCGYNDGRQKARRVQMYGIKGLGDVVRLLPPFWQILRG